MSSHEMITYQFPKVTMLTCFMEPFAIWFRANTINNYKTSISIDIQWNIYILVQGHILFPAAIHVAVVNLQTEIIHSSILRLPFSTEGTEESVRGEKKSTRKGPPQHVLLDILYLHKHRCWALWVKHEAQTGARRVSNLSLNQVCTWKKPQPKAFQMHCYVQSKASTRHSPQSITKR